MIDDELLPSDLPPLPPDEYWSFATGLPTESSRGVTQAMIRSSVPRRWWNPATWFAADPIVAAGAVIGVGRHAAIDAMHRALARRVAKDDYRDLTDSLDRLSKRLR